MPAGGVTKCFLLAHVDVSGHLQKMGEAGLTREADIVRLMPSLTCLLRRLMPVLVLECVNVSQLSLKLLERALVKKVLCPFPDRPIMVPHISTSSSLPISFSRLRLSTA